MQAVSSKIWTRVAVSISYDDNYYITGTSTTVYCFLKVLSAQLYDFKKVFIFI